MRDLTSRSKTRPVGLVLLDGFQLRDGARAVVLAPSAQRLVAFLALRERSVQRGYVAGQIWTDSSQEQANANLRTSLWRIKRSGCAVVAATATTIGLAPGVAVDIAAIVASANRVLDGAPAPDDPTILLQAGELLPDWYDDWLSIERERLRQLRLQALETLSQQLAVAGDYAAAIEAGLTAIAAEPLRESAHRAVISAHLAQGNVCEALRQFRVVRDLLAGELGIAPSPGLRALIARL